MASDRLLDRYLARVGLDGSDLSLEALHRAHVTSIPFENVDVLLGRGIPLDLELLVRDPYTQKHVAPDDLGTVLLDVFDLALASEEVAQLLARMGARDES